MLDAQAQLLAQAAPLPPGAHLGGHNGFLTPAVPDGAGGRRHVCGGRRARPGQDLGAGDWRGAGDYRGTWLTRKRGGGRRGERVLVGAARASHSRTAPRVTGLSLGTQSCVSFSSGRDYGNLRTTTSQKCEAVPRRARI